MGGSATVLFFFLFFRFFHFNGFYFFHYSWFTVFCQFSWINLLDEGKKGKRKSVYGVSSSEFKITGVPISWLSGNQPN